MDSRMAIFGTVATVRAQFLPVGKFAAAFSYLETLFAPGSFSSARLRAMPEGVTERIELSEGAFALEQVYTSKIRSDGFFESHRRYIDLQVIFEGKEWMEVIDLERSVLQRPYLLERDLIVHEDAADASRLYCQAGDVAVFFPVDVHMPCLAGSTGRALVRKTVIKIPVG
jgi:biofilm protein TabA